MLHRLSYVTARVLPGNRPDLDPMADDGATGSTAGGTTTSSTATSCTPVEIERAIAVADERDRAARRIAHDQLRQLETERDYITVPRVWMNAAVRAMAQAVIALDVLEDKAWRMGRELYAEETARTSNRLWTLREIALLEGTGCLSVCARCNRPIEAGQPPTCERYADGLRTLVHRNAAECRRTVRLLAMGTDEGVEDPSQLERVAPAPPSAACRNGCGRRSMLSSGFCSIACAEDYSEGAVRALRYGSHA